MKLRHRLGISLRLYFGLVRYSIFLDIFLLIVLSNLDFSGNVCGVVFIGFIVLWIIWLNSIKCPECKIKISSVYNSLSKYGKSYVFRIPEKCPCCGLDLDSV